MRKPRALPPGDRVTVVAPASSSALEELHAGLAEVAALGFVPQDDESVFERAHTAGPAAVSAEAFRRAWADPE